jgi:hypothetical protein
MTVSLSIFSISQGPFKSIKALKCNDPSIHIAERHFSVLFVLPLLLLKKIVLVPNIDHEYGTPRPCTERRQAGVVCQTGIERAYPQNSSCRFSSNPVSFFFG